MDSTVLNRMFRTYGAWILALGIIGVIGALVVTATQTPEFESRAKAIVSVQAAEDASTNDLVNADRLAQARAVTYVDVVESDQVLSAAITRLGLDTTPQGLAGDISASSSEASVVISIKATADTADGAAAIAGAVAQSFETYVETVLEVPAGADQSSVGIEIVDTGAVPTSAVSPRPSLNLGIGAITGLLIGSILALALALADRRLRSVGEIERVLGRPALGVAPRAAALLGMRPTGGSADSIKVTESLRAIRTNLTFVGARGDGMVFQVAAARRAEPVAPVVIGLAKAFAEIGARVVVVDADFASPKLAAMMRISRAAGLTDALSSRGDLASIASASPFPGVDVVPAGSANVENPSAMLASAKMSELLTQLASSYDVVLIAVAPLLDAADGAMLSRLTSGTVLVAGVGRVSSTELASAVDILNNLEAPVTGVIITQPVWGSRQRGALSSEAVTRITTDTEPFGA